MATELPPKALGQILQAEPTAQYSPEEFSTFADFATAYTTAGSEMTYGEIVSAQSEFGESLYASDWGPKQEKRIVDPSEAVTDTLVEPHMESLPVLVDTWLKGNITWEQYRHNELRLRTPLGTPDQETQETLKKINQHRIPHGFYQEPPVASK